MSAMNEMTSSQPVSAGNVGKALIGALLGAGIGFGCMRLAMWLRVPSKQLSLADFVAIWLGIVFLAAGVCVLFVASNRRRLARALEGQGAELPATNDEVRVFRMQAAVLALAGLLLLIPILAMGPLIAHPSAGWAIYAGVVVLFGVQTALNVRLWQSSDEFVRQGMLTDAAISFAICQGLLFLWAAAEHLHLAPNLSAWSEFTVLMTVYLGVGWLNTLRRGRVARQSYPS